MMKVFLALILLFYCTLSFAQDGTVDGTFTAATKVSFGAGGTGSRIAIQPDGKIIQAGSVASSTGDLNFGLVRFNLNGQSDNTFGTAGNGTVVTTVGAFEDYVYALAIQTDGKILVAGSLVLNHTTYAKNLAVVRYNSDGTIDNTFGTSGKVSLSINSAAEARSIAIQPDGKIVLAGSTNTTKSNVLLARLTTTGSYDNTFGTSGVVTASPGIYNDVANAVTLQPDGKIVLTGSSYINSGSEGSNFLVMRYNSNGTPDITFDGDGTVITNIYNGIPRSLAVQTDGKIITAGGHTDMTTGVDFTMTRYNADGSSDNSFGSNGIVFYPLVANTLNDYANAVLLQSDGKIIIGAQYSGLMSGGIVARFLNTGIIDNTFGTSGKTNFSYSIYNVIFQGTNILANSDLYQDKFFTYRLNNSVGGALPVTLLYFTAQKQGKYSSLLNWKTSQEINSARFDVERSGDAIFFSKIGSVVVAGNSSVPVEYFFTDNNPARGMNYYRLTQVDADGRFIYTPARLVRFDELNAATVKYYPNPTNGILTVELSSANGNEARVINITNAQGAVVYQLKIGSSAGTKMQIDLSRYPKGTYFIQLRTATINSTERIVLL